MASYSPSDGLVHSIPSLEFAYMRNCAWQQAGSGLGGVFLHWHPPYHSRHAPSGSRGSWTTFGSGQDKLLCALVRRERRNWELGQLTAVVKSRLPRTVLAEQRLVSSLHGADTGGNPGRELAGD